MFELAGLLTITGLLGVIATLLSIFGITSLFVIYVLPHIPSSQIEIGAYLISITLMTSDLYLNLNPNVELFLVFFGSIGLCPALMYSLHLHADKNGDEEKAIQFISFVCALIWGCHAFRLQSQLLGVFACGALFTFLGFMVFILPLCYIVGFTTKEAIIRCMNVAFYLLAIYIYAAVTGIDNDWYFYPFKQGILLLGGFVYFVGCLIISNKFYSWDRDAHIGRYLWCNIIALSSTFAAFVLGSLIPSLHYLQGLGGTFLMLLFLGKYCEIPWNDIGWAWGTAGLGVFLFVLVQFIHQYPQFLLQI